MSVHRLPKHPSPLLLWSKRQPDPPVRLEVLKKALQPLPIEALRRLVHRLGAGLPIAMEGPWYSHDRTYGDPFCEALPGPARREALKATHYPPALDLIWMQVADEQINTNPVISSRGKEYLFSDILSWSSRADLEQAARDAVQELARAGHR